MGNIRNFIGEKGYKAIRNMAYDEAAIRKALITPGNARRIFNSRSEEFAVEFVTMLSGADSSIAKVRPTTQAEIIEAFAKGGYDKVIFDDYDEILACKEYYRPRETICTYNNLRNRMSNYHMLVAVKENIDDIRRGNPPRRDDAYGTSILNVQIAKNGSHMSIKNRYNHTVVAPDNTFDNNLDVVSHGLQRMVLGYYGFAKIGRDKPMYPGIVEIGGVYLDWFAEANNVYYGDFALNGQTGPMYVDHERYFVVENGAHNSAFPSMPKLKTPVVFDFQKKEVIGPSAQAKFFTRDMKEGFLGSANKSDIGNIRNVYPDAKKELLQVDPKALQVMHERFGYDWTKPFKVVGFTGAFTKKSLEKRTGLKGSHLLLWRNNSLVTVACEDDEFVLTPRRYAYRTDDFDTKRALEKYRRSNEAAGFVIYQDPAFFLPSKQFPSLEEQRAAKLKRHTKKEYHKALERGNPPAMDKSRYLVLAYKHELNDRLRAYKASKLLAEAKSVDFSDKLREIEGRWLVLRKRMSDIAMHFEDSVPVIFDVFSSYRSRKLLEDIKKFRACTQENSFENIGQAKAIHNRIIEYIDSYEGNFRSFVPELFENKSGPTNEA